MSEIISGVEKAESEMRDEKRLLAVNAWHLARYLIEHDHQIHFPDKIHPGQFLSWSENYPNIEEEDKIKFINQYALLEKSAGNVTARTLYATRIHGHGFIHAAFKTSVGQYLVFLGAITVLFAFQLFNNWGGKSPSLFFYAAGLGACVFLLRITQ